MQDAQQAYFETQVLTAAPQKLRLMLIEGATRFATQTAEHWRASRREEGDKTLVRCREIVAELLVAIKPEDSAAAANTAAIYLFIFQALNEMQFEPDADRIDGIVQVLTEDRETWRQLCEIMPEAPVPPAGSEMPGELTADDFDSSAMNPIADTATVQGGFSLDA